MEYGQHQPIYKVCILTANHRISQNSCLRPFIACHMKMSKISLWKAVISLRLTLEFIFICQNANVIVQKEPLSLAAKETDPLIFFSCPIFFSVWRWVTLIWLCTLISAPKCTIAHPCLPNPIYLVCVHTRFLAFLPKCFLAQVNKDKVSHPC